MAKLENVKTIDMVNGEITKVAYDGAEYGRVEGEAKAGDIVLVKEAWGDQNVGEFFIVTCTNSGIHDQIVGMDGNTCGASTYKYRLKIFRKVEAATKPSVEERVAKAEGEIESLKSDVAALKGEAEYKRIVKSEARVGDYVKFIETDDSSITVGKMYEIVHTDYEGYLDFIDDDGDKNCGVSSEVFEIHRKVSAAEPKPERLKVGDYAKVVNTDQFTMEGFRDGDIVEIVTSVFGEDDADFRVKSLTRKLSGYSRKTPDYIVRATDEEVAEAKNEAARAKFKKGDKVRLLSGGEDYPLGGFKNGKIYEVSDNDYNHQIGTLIRIEGGNCYRGAGFATPDQLEILSEEEVAKIEREAAERKKWAEIGRKVGEYKKGDVVQFTDDYVAIGIVEDVGTSFLGVRMPDEGYQGPFKSDVTLITPVEARFDR